MSNPEREAKEEAAVGDAEATQRAKTLQELLSKEVPHWICKKVGIFEEGGWLDFGYFFLGAALIQNG